MADAAREIASDREPVRRTLVCRTGVALFLLLAFAIPRAGAAQGSSALGESPEIDRGPQAWWREARAELRAMRPKLDSDRRIDAMRALLDEEQQTVFDRNRRLRSDRLFARMKQRQKRAVQLRRAKSAESDAASSTEEAGGL